MELELASADNRRYLWEVTQTGNWKVLKIIEAKEDCILGNHMHKNKDELFYLVSGSATFNNKVELNLQERFIVPRGTFHEFKLTKGSILLCLASELHDHNDDHK